MRFKRNLTDSCRRRTGAGTCPGDEAAADPPHVAGTCDQAGHRPAIGRSALAGTATAGSTAGTMMTKMASSAVSRDGCPRASGSRYDPSLTGENNQPRGAPDLRANRGRPHHRVSERAPAAPVAGIRRSNRTGRSHSIIVPSPVPPPAMPTVWAWAPEPPSVPPVPVGLPHARISGYTRNMRRSGSHCCRMRIGSGGREHGQRRADRNHQERLTPGTAAHFV